MATIAISKSPFFITFELWTSKVIKLANFTVVENPTANDINLYYFKRNGFYYKATSFYENEIYYTSDISGTG